MAYVETYARPARSAAGAKQKAGDLIFGSFYALTVVAAEVDERRVEIGLVDRPWEAFVSRALLVSPRFVSGSKMFALIHICSTC